MARVARRRSLIEDRENPYVRAIVDTAVRLFAEKGYLGTSMRDLGDDVGVHAGSLYVHIQSKEELLFAIIWRVCERSETDMSEVLALDAGPLEKLRQIAIRQMELVTQNLDAATIYFHEWRYLKPAHRTKVVASRNRWESGLRELLKNLVDDGTFAPIDVKLAGFAFVSMLNWTYEWYSPKGPLTGRDLAEQYFNFFVEGLRRR